VIAESQGNMQLLPGGNWLVGWGQAPEFSEYGPEGQLLLDALLPIHTQSYRDFVFPWVGTPAHGPALAFQAGGGGGAGTVYASWNGATQVATWLVLAGRTPATMRPVVSAPRSGFETAIAVPAGTVGPYLRVQAFAASGQSLGVSGASAQRGLPG
jgi:hypothetical protein